MRGTKRLLGEKLLALFLMAAVSITMIPAGLALCQGEAYAATTYSYTVSKPSVKIHGTKVHVATFTVSGVGVKGTCCQAGKEAKSGKTTVKKISNTDIRAKLIYYYGYQKGYLGKANMNGFLLGRALSWESGNTRTKPATKAEVKNFINAMPSSVTVPNRFECYFCNPTNGSQNFVAYKMNPPAYITLNKTSANAYSTAAGSGYSFEGIEYSVYSSSGALAGKLTCKANGTTNKLTLDTGTYTVKETKTNKWYKLNTQVYTKTVTAGQTWTIAAKDAPQTGTIHIKKKVQGNYDGDMAFAFRLTNTANPNIVYNVITDKETGEASISVIEGTYRCEEILPENSDVIDMTGVQTGTVRIGETFTFERANRMPSSGTLLISKSTNDGGSPAGFRFKVTGQLYNQGTMTEEKILQAADPAVSGYDEELYEPGPWKVSEKDLEALNDAAAERVNESRTVTLTSTLKYKGGEASSISDIVEALTEEDEGIIKKGTIITDEGKSYRAVKDAEYEIVFEEIAEPVRLAEKTSVEKRSAGKTIDTEKTIEHIRELLSGDTFEETNLSDIALTAEVKVNLLPVEYHHNNEDPRQSGYETDLDNQISNKKQKTENKDHYEIQYNCFDWKGAATLFQEVRNGELTGNREVILETGENGRTPELEEGITCGKFTVSEVMTDSQKAKYKEAPPQTKEVKAQTGHAAFVFSFENKANWTGAGLVKTSDDGNVSGITFRLEGTDVRGEKVEQEAVTDSDGRIDFGKLYAGDYIISEKDFDPDRYENPYKLEGYDVPAQKLKITGEETADVEVKFHNVPLKSLYLTKVDKESRAFLKNAVFALYEGKKELALFRLILDDEGQAAIDMIRCDAGSGLVVGTAQTSELAADDGSSLRADNQEEEAENQEKENDEIEPIEFQYAVIRGLKEGCSYTIKEITAPTGYAASVDQNFVFEDGKKLILENAAPEIATSAVDRATKNHMSDAEGMVTIVDTVSYSNLCPGHKYLVSGVLALKPDQNRTVEEIEDDAEIVEIVKDAKGKEVTAQKEFVPDAESGTVDMEFRFDASLLDGKQAVAMEQLVDPALTGVNGVITVVASHEDIEDEAQTIYFPRVRTWASADDTGKRVTEADGSIVITDKVEYSNVIAGKVYELTGTLMDKETGKPLLSGGSKVTSTVRFRAEKEGPVFAAQGETLKDRPEGELELVSGTAELKFSFDGTGLGGKGAVVFEKLYTSGSLVGEHSDINDEKQTVYLPGITTTAATNGTDTVTDKVLYKNLLAGEKYIVKGQLMDKSTGRELVVDGRDFTAQMEFVPQQRNGSITLEFPVDAKDLRGKTAVVFESCYLVGESELGRTETEVISHKDINNKAQTVSFHVPQTGQTLPWKLLLPAGVMAMTALSLFLRRQRKGGRV